MLDIASGARFTVTAERLLRSKTLDVTRQKGFTVEYCEKNDEFVATIKDSDAHAMGIGGTIDEAVEALRQDMAAAGEQVAAADSGDA